MKKILLTLGSVFTLAILVSSCKSHERCPAYGKIITETPVEIPS